jgi:hypothetical protein
LNLDRSTPLVLRNCGDDVPASFAIEATMQYRCQQHCKNLLPATQCRALTTLEGLQDFAAELATPTGVACHDAVTAFVLP